MSTLVDHQIKYLSETHKLIEPYNKEQQNPGSYDVTLGSKLLVERPPYLVEGALGLVDNRWLVFDISKMTYHLKPGEFVLACTEEVVSIPDYLEAVFCLKSSRGREGWEHALAGYIDPGFVGRVTLELKNNNQFHSLPMKAGLRIGQLRFSRMDDVPDAPYNVTGRYNNDLTTTPSKG